MKVEIEATVHAKESMILRISCGTASIGDKSFELSNSAAGTPIVRLPDGQWISFSWEALVHAAEQAGKAS